MSLVDPSYSSHKVNFLESKNFDSVDSQGVKFDIVGIGVIPRTYRLKMDDQSHELHLTVYFFFGIFKKRVDLSKAKVNSNSHKAWMAVVSCKTMPARTASKAFFSDKSTFLFESLEPSRREQISKWVLVEKCNLKAVKTQVAKRVIPPKILVGINVSPQRLKVMLHLIETSPEALTEHINSYFKTDNEEALNKRKEYQYFLWHYLSHSNGQYRHRLFQVCRLLCLCANIPELEQNKDIYKLLEHLPPVILKDVMLNWKIFKTTSSESTSSEDDLDSQTDAFSEIQIQSAVNLDSIDSSSSIQVQLPESTEVALASSTLQAHQTQSQSSNELEHSPTETLEVIESMSSFNLMQTMLTGLLSNREIKFCESLNKVNDNKETEELLEIICPSKKLNTDNLQFYFDSAWDLLLFTDNYQMNQCRQYFQSFMPLTYFNKKLVDHYEEMMRNLPIHLQGRFVNTFVQFLHYSKIKHQRVLVDLLSSPHLKFGPKLIDAYRDRYKLFPFEQEDSKDEFVEVESECTIDGFVEVPSPESIQQCSEEFDEVDDATNLEQDMHEDLLIIGRMYFEIDSELDEQEETDEESDDAQEYARISGTVKSSPEVARRTERTYSI